MSFTAAPNAPSSLPLSIRWNKELSQKLPQIFAYVKNFPYLCTQIDLPMKAYTPCPWSKDIVRMTLFVLFALILGIAIIGVIYFTAENLDNSDKHQLLFWSGVIVVVIVLALAYAPQGISADDQKIILHRHLGKVIIFRSDIRSIKRFDPDTQAVRLFGVGGFMGIVGLCYSSKLGGVFTAYITDPSRSYVIYRRSKRPIIITSVEPLN